MRTPKWSEVAIKSGHPGAEARSPAIARAGRLLASLHASHSRANMRKRWTTVALAAAPLL